MSDLAERVDPVEQAFRLAKLQASVDGAFDDELLRFWFDTAWSLCAEMIGFTWPPQFITEPIIVRPDGSFRLSHQPSSEIKVYDGATLLMVLPKSGERNPCHPGLCPCCACCTITAHYWAGDETCTLSPTFLQAVCRLFTYLCENRGDTQADGRILNRSGAFAFLAADACYVL